ncbi:STAS domain-containing protein [Fictibacillus iocasae]|uniref:STAS domain-containing protein n=1 Tax=Fictibacillus iocasae TaxID=2715437 RepID=A0ABW2NUH6_9BACL
MLTYDLKVDPETILVEFQGDIDTYAADLFYNGLYIIADHENRSFCLQFEHVEMIDPEGLEFILTMISKVTAKGNQVKVANLASDIHHVLLQRNARLCI